MRLSGWDRVGCSLTNTSEIYTEEDRGWSPDLGFASRIAPENPVFYCRRRPVQDHYYTMAISSPDSQRCWLLVCFHLRGRITSALKCRMSGLTTGNHNNHERVRLCMWPAGGAERGRLKLGCWEINFVRGGIESHGPCAWTCFHSLQDLRCLVRDD